MSRHDKDDLEVRATQAASGSVLQVIAAACAVAAITLLALAAPGVARADGDPASDVLLVSHVFYPYSSAVSPALHAQLDHELSLAARARFPIRVALIGSRSDLGAVGQLLGRPQIYARFLDLEIGGSIAPVPLLVVMPDGYGVVGLSGPVGAVVARLRRPAARDADALVRSAITAVATLAAATGRPLAGYAASASGASGSRPWVWVAVAAILFVFGAIGLAVRRRRRRSPVPG